MDHKDLEFGVLRTLSIEIKDIKADEYSLSSIQHSPVDDRIVDSRCGEILTANCYDFVLACAFCNRCYNTVFDFGRHLREIHVQAAEYERGYANKEPSLKEENYHGNEISDAVYQESDQQLGDKTQYDTSEDCQQDIILDNPKKNLFLPLHASTMPVVSQSKINNKEGRRGSFQKHSLTQIDRFSCGDCKHNYESRSELLQHECLAISESELSQKSINYKKSTGFEQLLNPAKSLGSTTTEEKAEPNRKLGNKMLYVKIARTRNGKEPTTHPDLFCDICYRQFKVKSVFRKHAMKHAEPPTALRNDPEYLKCRFCGEGVTNAAEWKKHEAAHVETTPFRCTQCDKSFRTEHQMKMHDNIHKGLRPYKCDQCGFSFAHKSNLNQHVKRVHLKQTSHTCTVCNKKFLNNSEMSYHMRQHKDEKPYQCHKCGQSFRMSWQLTRHSTTHKEVRDVSCPICPMAFKSKRRLQDHMIKHSDERPHVCSTCGNSFSRRKALILHLKLHQDFKEYACHICDKRFAQPAGLLSHKQSHLKMDN